MGEVSQEHCIWVLVLVGEEVVGTEGSLFVRGVVGEEDLFEVDIARVQGQKQVGILLVVGWGTLVVGIAGVEVIAEWEDMKDLFVAEGNAFQENKQVVVVVEEEERDRVVEEVVEGILGGIAVVVEQEDTVVVEEDIVEQGDTAVVVGDTVGTETCLLLLSHTTEATRERDSCGGKNHTRYVPQKIVF
jgi:hypothetical protein